MLSSKGISILGKAYTKWQNEEDLNIDEQVSLVNEQRRAIRDCIKKYMGTPITSLLQKAYEGGLIEENIYPVNYRALIKENCEQYIDGLSDNKIEEEISFLGINNEIKKLKHDLLMKKREEIKKEYHRVQQSFSHSELEELCGHHPYFSTLVDDYAIDSENVSFIPLTDMNRAMVNHLEDLGEVVIYVDGIINPIWVNQRLGLPLEQHPTIQEMFKGKIEYIVKSKAIEADNAEIVKGLKTYYPQIIEDIKDKTSMEDDNQSPGN